MNSTASELIRWMEVPGHPNVFALGNFARQVTFASQQARAFNLVWALFRANRLMTGQRVAVVGAGLGGMTAAVAALAKGCYVDLYEQASQPCPIQRGNDIRFIHPNILRWPDEGAETAQTDFPFLNWTAANVRGVIKQIDLQWKQHVTNNRRLRRFFNYKVNRLYASLSRLGPQQPWLTANRVVDGSAAGDETSDGMTPGYLQGTYSCIILAIGFGEERAIPGVPFLSYWENDSLHQETGRGRRSILVSGCGDGGLIDALRLRLRNFDHADFVRRFLGAARSGVLIKELKKVDRDLRHQAGSPDISLQFQLRYDAINVPEDVESYFRSEKRSDTSVTLNSPKPGPFTFGASLLNRYATYLAMRYADLHYLSGRIVADRATVGNYQVIIQRDDIDISDTRLYDLVIVRHGPENVISNLISDSARREFEIWWEKNEDITTESHWRVEDARSAHQFYREFETETVPPAEEVLDLALATFDSAYREFIRDPEVQSIAVGEHEGKAGFIVTLRTGTSERQSRLYAGVLVQYVSPVGISSVQKVRTQRKSSLRGFPPGARLLPVGSGIYNYDAQERATRIAASDASQSGSISSQAAGRHDSYPAGTGTLGCFADDHGGNVYLISTNYVLALDNLGQQGDRIFLEGQSPSTNHAPIATLDRMAFDPMTGIDIAAARLEPGVYPNYSPLIPTWQPERVGQSVPGDLVAKVGRTSGLTIGRVIAADGSGVIMYGIPESIRYSNYIMIVSVTPERSDFSLQGDGGALIVREDGTAVGILVARSIGTSKGQGTALACSLSPALQHLDLTLLTEKYNKGGSRRTDRRLAKSRRVTERKAVANATK